MTAHSRIIHSTPAGIELLSIPVDGTVLSGRLFRPEGGPRAAIVLHGAVGVPMGYYRAFATWLAGQGFACLTYDYSDFGASLRGPVRSAKARLVDWGIRDQSAALATLRRQVPDVPVWVIGHSIGGTMLGFQPGMTGVARVITVGSGMVHLGDHPWPYRALAAFFWYGLPALGVSALGYLPGRLIGFGADLPAGVYHQWRRWCTRRGFYLSDVGRSLPLPDPTRVTGRMTVIAIDDDKMVPPPAVWRLMSLYPEAVKRQRVLRPADFGLHRIGHLGAFHRSNAVVWPALIA
jgi:predicted alpha/beta hydrolase